jgi:hypothetical protein
VRLGVPARLLHSFSIFAFLEEREDIRDVDIPTKKAGASFGDRAEVVMCADKKSAPTRRTAFHEQCASCGTCFLSRFFAQICKARSLKVFLRSSSSWKPKPDLTCNICVLKK